jgi:hypothetical protein
VSALARFDTARSRRVYLPRLRVTYTLPDTKWTGQLRADIGGFGVGSESTWQIWGDVRYAFSDSFSANVGYRALEFDYEADNAHHDITMSGPVIGILWNF